MRCKDYSQVRGYPYKRSHLVALRPTKISANDPPSTWWPGERRWPPSPASSAAPPRRTGRIRPRMALIPSRFLLRFLFRRLCAYKWVATENEFNGIGGLPIYIRIVPVRGTFRTGERTFQCKRSMPLVPLAAQ